MHTVCFLDCRFILNVIPYSAQETLIVRGTAKKAFKSSFHIYHSRISLKNIDQQQYSK